MYKRNKKIACALLLMMVINNTSSSVLARPLNKEYQSLVMQSVDDVKIVSHSTITIDEAKKWAIKRNATPTFVSLADLFWKYAPSHGDVNPAVAYVQAALETGYGRYGNVLDETYHNTCGLKRTDAGTSTDDSDKEAHKRFDNWDHGVQAHLDHLALYAGAVGYPKTNIEQNYLGDKIDKDSTYDPRHFSYLAGRAHTVKELSNNWAGEGYGDKLIDLYNSLLSESEVENNESDNKPSDEKKQGWYQDSKYNWYYYDSNGKAHKGWLQLPDGKYYMNENGIMVTGWLQEKGSWYYFESSGRAIVNRNEVIDGVEYEFNSEGVSKARAGWQQDNQHNWHYYDDNGLAHIGWLKLPDGKYYMNENGIMVTGWLQKKGTGIILKSSGRAIVNRNEVIDGIEYEFNSEGVSKARAGWQQDNQHNWHYYDDNGLAHIGWLKLPDGKYYMNENGIMVTGWLQKEGNWYYFESSGRAIVNRNEVIDGVEYEFNSEGVSKARAGWQQDNQHNWHYYDDNGLAHIGWLKLPDGKYYMNENGIMVTGWLQKEGNWYYFESSGRAIVNRNEVIDGVEYEFNSEGVSKARAGWQQDNQHNWHYYDDNGLAHIGWLKLPDGKYYMNENGIMVTGWLQKEGNWYYFESSGRAIVNRNEVIDGVEYEFNSEGVSKARAGWQQDNQHNWHYYDDNGLAHIGWLKLPDGKYYMNENGIMVTGWLQKEGNWYYFESSGRAIVNRNEVIDGVEYEFNSEGVSKARAGWQQDNQHNWHYYDDNGLAHIGWLKLPDGKYYMNENGIMVTGWLQKKGTGIILKSSGRAIVNRKEVIDGVEYEFNSEGVSKARAGWHQDNQHNWYYYDDNGLAHIGWLNLPDGKYYMNENGIMVTGWLQKEGNWYYFESSGRAIVNRKEVIDGVEYEFNSEGVSKARAGWHQDNQHNWYYYDDNGLAHIGWLNLPDGKYYMNENGIMVTGWLQEKGSWYYFDKDGRQSYGFIEIEGLRYYLDEEGKAQTGWKNIDGKEYYFYDDCHAAQFEFVDGKYIGHEGYVKNKMTIVIDPGHNQRGDTGASYTHDGVLYDETKMNMDVSVKLRDALVAAGYEVIMTRQPDEYQTSSNVSQSLLNRVVLANNAKADLFISIHHDSFNDTANGMTIFYDTYRPNIETNGVLEDSDGNSYDTTPSRAAIVSKNFTSDLAKNLPSSLGLYNRGARYRNFYVTRNTTMPSMLIECGFISNPNEAKKLADPLHQLKMAGELATNINKLYRK